MEKVIVTDKLNIATCSLGGCFGCHMSFLDMDEYLEEVNRYFRFDRSPFTDIKTLGVVDIGLIEGGICNDENLEVLKQFRQRCKILVAVGACAINGGLPALRNQYSAEQCLREVYEDGLGLVGKVVPDDEELPPLTRKVFPLHEAVAVDYFLPGCPPPAPAFAELLQAVREQREPAIDYVYRHFD